MVVTADLLFGVSALALLFLLILVSEAVKKLKDYSQDQKAIRDLRDRVLEYRMREEVTTKLQQQKHFPTNH